MLGLIQKVWQQVVLGLSIYYCCDQKRTDLMKLCTAVTNSRISAAIMVKNGKMGGF